MTITMKKSEKIKTYKIEIWINFVKTILTNRTEKLENN